MPKPGWLKRQFDQVSRDISTWPEWMRRKVNLGDKAMPGGLHRTDVQTAPYGSAAGDDRAVFSSGSAEMWEHGGFLYFRQEGSDLEFHVPVYDFYLGWMSYINRGQIGTPLIFLDVCNNTTLTITVTARRGKVWSTFALEKVDVDSNVRALHTFASERYPDKA